MGINWGPTPHLSNPSVPPPCPQCNSTDVEIIGRSPSTNMLWLLCRSCGHVWSLVN